MRALFLVLMLALATSRTAHAGWTSKQRAALDEIVALENAGRLEQALARAEEEFGRIDAPDGFRRTVAKRGKAVALTLFERSNDPRHLCSALQLLRVYAADLMKSEADRLEIPAELADLEARAVAVAATCATSEPRTSTALEPAAASSALVLIQPERPEVGPDDDLLPVNSTRAAKTARRPVAGRGLLLVGGILAGGASIAGGLAAGAGVQADRLTREQNRVAVATHEQGFSTPDMTQGSERLVAGVTHWNRTAIVAALSFAALGSTAIALITAGSVKRRRATRTALAPGLGALLFSARF